MNPSGNHTPPVPSPPPTSRDDKDSAKKRLDPWVGAHTLPTRFAQAYSR
jgi:hypothetical protein